MIRSWLQVALGFAVASVPFVAVAPAIAQADAPAVRFAEAVIELEAPAQDRPDVRALRCLEAVAELRSHGFAAALLERLSRRLDLLQQPAALLEPLDALLDNADLHGRVRSQVSWLRYRMLHACGRGDELVAADPMAGQPDSFRVVGPFGSSEDRYAQLAFAPELVRWPADADFAAARRPARVLRRGVGERRIDPVDPGDGERGCFYVLHRVQADAETQGYLALWCSDTLQVFVNGRRLLTISPALLDGRRSHCVPVGFAAGVNHVMVKTCSPGAAVFALRYVDARWRPLRQLREIPAEQAVAPPPAPIAAVLPPFVSLDAEYERACAGLDDDGQLLRLARGFLADSLGLREGQLRAVDGLLPTRAPAQLVAARLWLQLAQMPQQVRSEQARQLVAAAKTQLVDADGDTAHWAMLQAQVRDLEERDQREQALLALWRAVDDGAAGPETFRLLAGVIDRARFRGERERLLERWRERLPADPEPWLLSSRAAHRAGANGRAAELVLEALRLRPDDGGAMRHAYTVLGELGRGAQVRAAFREFMPERLGGDARRVGRRLWQLGIAAVDEDESQWLGLCAEMLGDPAASAAQLLRLAHQLCERGHVDRAAQAYRAVLARTPDDRVARQCLGELGVEASPGAAFARFRRDGRAAIAALQQSERTHGAMATTLIDQRLVEVLADGSQVVEVHELRRLNDPDGVAAYSDASAVAEADEVLLLRTIDAEGNEYVPVQVDDGYAMPRLEPGVFVEWRYRTFVAAPEDGVPEIEPFLFGSTSDELLLSELVVIRPRGAGVLQLRHRGFDGPSEVVALDAGREALCFRRRDVAQVVQEPAMPALSRLVPVVAAGDDRGADEVLRNWAFALRSMVQPTPRIRERVASLLDGVEGDVERFDRLHHWCHAEIASGRSQSANETLVQMQGNRVQLLLAMLATAGFELQPALCESMRADLFDDGAPLFDDASVLFDEWCVRVPLAGRAPRWLCFGDARYTPADWVPPQRSSAMAMVRTGEVIELTRLPTTAEHGQHLVVRGDGRIDGRTLAVAATIEMRGDDTWRAAEHFLQQPAAAARQFARQFASQVFAGFEIERAELLELRPGSVVRVAVKARRRSLQATGDGALLPVPLVATRFRAGLSPKPGRRTPMRFSTDLQFDWLLRFELDGVAPAALPDALALVHGPVSYLQEVAMRDGRLVVRRQATLRPGDVAVDELLDWAAVLERIERAEQLSLPCRVE